MFFNRKIIENVILYIYLVTKIKVQYNNMLHGDIVKNDKETIFKSELLILVGTYIVPIYIYIYIYNPMPSR